jgi:hypothetical protein
MRKCRPDFLSEEKNVIDLKTTINASPEAFGKQSFNLRYHWSACWTSEIIQGLTGPYNISYVLIAVEKESPWAVACYEVPNVLIDLARSEITPLIAKYRACQEIGSWPAYSNDVETLYVPPWAIKKEKEDY